MCFKYEYKLTYLIPLFYVLVGTSPLERLKLGLRGDMKSQISCGVFTIVTLLTKGKENTSIWIILFKYNSITSTHLTALVNDLSVGVHGGII